MNLFLSIFLFAISGVLVSLGLVIRVKNTMDKALSKKNNIASLGIIFKLTGLGLLAYLVFNFKDHNLIFGLISFSVSSITIILWILLARRGSIR